MKRNLLVILFVFTLITPCFAGNHHSGNNSYRHEENQIRNQRTETMTVVYYQDGEKIAADSYQGNKNSVKFSTEEIRNTAKEIKADEVVFIHNHPSGTTNLSNADIKTAEKIERNFSKDNIKTSNVVVTKTKEREY